MSVETIRTISPSTNQVIVEREGVTIDESRKIAASAAGAFKQWKTVPLRERKNIITKALELIQNRKDDLAHELTVQMGRPIAYSVKEIETMQKRADYLLDVADEVLADIPGRIQESGFRRYIRKEPVGPVLIVFAWNVNALCPS